MNIDFVQDFANHLRAQLQEAGFNVQQLLSSEDVVRAYLNVKRRLIEPTPRGVFRAEGFSCPQEHQAGLKLLEEKIETGEDLSPHLSKKLHKQSKDPFFSDVMLDHWGIHHLHLGTTFKKNGTVIDHDGQLLYARFDRSNVYFLGFYDHKSWHLQVLAQQIHDNWPETIAAFRLNGISATDISDAQVKTLREKCGNHFLRMRDGTTYAPLGGGIVSAGVSLEVIRQADYIQFSLKDKQDQVIARLPEIRSAASKSGCTVLETPTFNLVFQENEMFVIEQHSRISFPLGPLLS